MNIEELIYQGYINNEKDDFGRVYNNPSHRLIYKKLDVLDFKLHNQMQISLREADMHVTLLIGTCSKNRLYVKFSYHGLNKDDETQHGLYRLCEPQYLNTDFKMEYAATLDGMPKEFELDYCNPSDYRVLDETVPHEVGIQLVKHFLKYGKFPAGTSLKGSGEGLTYWIAAE